MEYSVQQDASYYFCCRFWSRESSPFSEPTGFSDWQHATGQKYGLTLHNLSVEHLRCMMEWDQFKIREYDIPIPWKQEVQHLGIIIAAARFFVLNL